MISLAFALRWIRSVTGWLSLKKVHYTDSDFSSISWKQKAGQNSNGTGETTIRLWQKFRPTSGDHCISSVENIYHLWKFA